MGAKWEQSLPQRVKRVASDGCDSRILSSLYKYRSPPLFAQWSETRANLF